MRIALGVQYDGRNFQGWQAQPGGRTVQDELERALSRFSDEPIRVVAAGRTDAGVHALGQVVHFDTTAVRNPGGWVRGVNSLLPISIAVSWSHVWHDMCAPTVDGFHARFSACARTYHYVLFVDPVRSPHLAGRVGWSYHRIDLKAMQSAAECVLGSHDFSAFRSSECQAKSPVKTLHEVAIRSSNRFIVMTFCADAFLHHMVRNLVGSLLAVGQGKHPAGWLDEVLKSRDRAAAAPTFMPDGLYLAKVDYPERFSIPDPPGLDAVFPGLLERQGAPSNWIER